MSFFFAINILIAKPNFKLIQKSLHVAQLDPEYPGAHCYVYDVPVTWHVAEFKQGFGEQGLESFFFVVE